MATNSSCSQHFHFDKGDKVVIEIHGPDGPAMVDDGKGGQVPSPEPQRHTGGVITYTVIHDGQRPNDYLIPVGDFEKTPILEISGDFTNLVINNYLEDQILAVDLHSSEPGAGIAFVGDFAVIRADLQGERTMATLSGEVQWADVTLLPSSDFEVITGEALRVDSRNYVLEDGSLRIEREQPVALNFGMSLSEARETLAKTPL